VFFQSPRISTEKSMGVTGGGASSFAVSQVIQTSANIFFAYKEMKKPYESE